jgi:hypothetical protein
MSKWRLGNVWEHCEGERERKSGVWLESGFAENSTLHSSIKCLRLVIESSTLFLGYNGTSNEIGLINDSLGQINQQPNQKGHGKCTY